VILVCNAVFRLTISCCIPEIGLFAINFREVVRNSAEISLILGRQIFWEEPPKFLAKSGDDRPSDLRDYTRRKKKAYKRKKIP